MSDTLPKAIFGFVMKLCSVVARVIANAFDKVISFFTDTVFRPFTHKEHPLAANIKAFLAGEEKTGKIISSTLSYGMIMICIGLIITLLYLLYLLFS